MANTMPPKSVKNGSHWAVRAGKFQKLRKVRENLGIPGACSGKFRTALYVAGCSWVRQRSVPNPHTRSTAWMPTTGRSLKSSERIPNATLSLTSLNVGTSTAALLMEKLA
jgi:hypothetical protein